MKNTGDYEEYEQQIAAKAAASIMGLITTPDADLLGEPTQSDDDSLPADEEMRAGIMRYLAPGEHLEVLDPKRPNPNVTQFIECQLRASGAGIGASEEPHLISAPSPFSYRFSSSCNSGFHYYNRLFWFSDRLNHKIF